MGAEIRAAPVFFMTRRVVIVYTTGFEIDLVHVTVNQGLEFQTPEQAPPLVRGQKLYRLHIEIEEIREG